MTKLKQLESGVRQAGVGLAAAIFVITLLAVIVVGINALVSDNSQAFEEEINLNRAFFAAESGAGFAMNGVYPPEEYSSYAGTQCNGTPGSPVVYTFDADVAGLGYCRAEVHCTQITISSTNYLTIESKGICGDVERTIQVRTVY